MHLRRVSHLGTPPAVTRSVTAFQNSLLPAFLHAAVTLDGVVATRRDFDSLYTYSGCRMRELWDGSELSLELKVRAEFHQPTVLNDCRLQPGAAIPRVDLGDRIPVERVI